MTCFLTIELHPQAPSKRGGGFLLLVDPEYISAEMMPLTITVPGSIVYNIVVERPSQ